MTDSDHRPTGINLHSRSRQLALEYGSGQSYSLSCEYLRVYSPSAEVRGHTPDQAKLQLGKEGVNITDLRQIGNYALKIFFDDGHNSGLYDWQYLYRLGRAWQPLWQDYLRRLQDAGQSRSGTDPFEMLNARGERPAELPGHQADVSAGSI